MSETKKLLFVDFDSKINSASTKNNLSIKHISNLTVNNGKIKSNAKVEEFFKSYLSQSEYEDLLNYYYGLDVTSLKIIPYEYTDSESGESKLRIFLFDIEKCLKEYIPASHTLKSFEQYFNSLPFAVCHKQQLFLFDSNSEIYMLENSSNPTLITNGLNIVYVKFYKEQTYFMVDGKPNTIYISKDKSFEEIAKGELPTETIVIDTNYGKLQDILFCDNYVFIVQDYGIAKIQTTKDETIFTYFETHTKIKSGTAKTVNDYIVFCSESSIFRFDGNHIVSLCQELAIKEPITAESFENFYYLSTKIKHGDSFEDSFLEIDTTNKTVNILQFGKVVELYENKHSISHKLQIAVDNGNAREMLVLTHEDNPNFSALKSIEFNKLFLDSFDNKTIQKLVIIGKGTFSIEIVSSNQEKISHKTTDCLKLFNMFMCGHYFDIKIYSLSSFEIDSIYLEYKVNEHA